MIKVEFYREAEDSLLEFAVILSIYKGKWLFCKHRERDTYECPGGHREPGEEIDDTARRELYEETGAVAYDLKSLGVYCVRETTDAAQEPAVKYGMLYYAVIRELGPMPKGYEIERIQLFEEPPENWTYPEIQPFLFNRLKELS